MAILNGLYIHVVDENMSREVEAASHPVESGLPITGTVRAKALSLSISGKIVNYDGMTAAQVLSQIADWQQSGSLIRYQGRNLASDMQILSFEASYPNTNSGGADFSMELVQARIAKSAYTPKQQSETEREEAAKQESAAIRVGSVVVFKGGPVYRSSDAKKKAATRDRSTCKVTQISKKSYSIHPYHLISKDGGKVYGWVDRKNIEGAQRTGTAGATNAGTQQVQSGGASAVYHKVKRGDTLYALVNRQYKLGKTVGWVMKNNPHAFSKAGDARTLQVGKKLLMGYR